MVRHTELFFILSYLLSALPCSDCLMYLQVLELAGFLLISCMSGLVGRLVSFLPTYSLGVGIKHASLDALAVSLV